jgi:hypothetical protein
MKLKIAGCYRELPHGDEAGVKLSDLVSESVQPHEDEVIAYLQSGIIFITCFGFVGDVLNPDSDFEVAPHLLTDGSWLWYNDLYYYVKNYHVRLPSEFVNHMKSKEWKISPEEIDLEAIEKEYDESGVTPYW